MREFLLFLWDTRGGIFMLLLFFASILILIRYCAWIFGRGRFSPSCNPDSNPANRGTLAYVVTDFFVKLINDFRHLLALVLVFIFAAVLFFTIWRSQGTTDDLVKGIQAVTSTLGVLIGSIIGYYFGETAGRKTEAGVREERVQQAAPTQALPSDQTAPPVTPAPPPPDTESH